MSKFSSVCLNHFLFVFFIFTLLFSCSLANIHERKVYIVYMGSLPEGEYFPTSHHATILEEILEGSSVSETLVTSYKRSFNGFAAKLTNAERERLASRSEVVSVFPSETLQLQTSKSWNFMGLLETSKRNHSVESDTIIGVIDTGMWIDSPSFNDVGFSRPPEKWKGVCAGGENFTCNNKVIGARFYPTLTAIDGIGHGSHTASIAAGNYVKDASFFGVEPGLARGGVPSARIAVYKVCGNSGCAAADILAAFDDAISDGVDILTVSLGSPSANDVTRDVIAIGSFHAMSNNILTTQPAGNSGPYRGTTASVAPWLFSVAASNTNRRFVDKLILGNKKEYIGNAINSFSLKAKDLPIVFGVNASKVVCDAFSAEACESFCLDPKLVKGKIVLCLRNVTTAAAEALYAGAAGVIVASGPTDNSIIVPLPAAVLSVKDLYSVVAYYNSTKYPTATILKSEGLKIGSPPEVVSFSSRGPNVIIPDILKPDISAPGVDILAAYSPFALLTQLFPWDGRQAYYSVISGTSMACPHVAGAAAYVKTFHPTWSPSAIKSALMTTAWLMKPTVKADYEFAYGSGHVNPIKAVDPGLVYETTKVDYIKMLCDTGLNQDKVRLISGDKSTCPRGSGKTGSFGKELNYPSISAYLNNSDAFKVVFTRTVTNVGSANSVYNYSVVSNKSTIKVAIEPSVLSFKSIGEKKSFNVTVSGSSGLSSIFSGGLTWYDGVHNVHSPIVLYADVVYG